MSVDVRTASTVASRPPPPPKAAPEPEAGPDRRRLYAGMAVLIGWVLLHFLLKGQDTLSLARSDLTGPQEWLNKIDDRLQGSWVLGVTGAVSDALNSVLTFLQELLSQPAFPRPVPEIGWLGVLAVATWLTLALAGWKYALLTAAAFASFGLLGYWEDSLDLLIVTMVSVVICLLIGIPLGIWMARSQLATSLLTPVLDVMQTMPSFVYLLPMSLLFGIGTAAAVIATLIYAVPPVIRITAYGIRSVSPATMEATTSMGSSRGQLLSKVQLPMAKRTIIVGVNQTTMAALSMATIAAFIDGPGLGQVVVVALQSLDVGTAFVGGLCIVIMAVMLDRVTTAAAERSEVQLRGGPSDTRRHWIVLGVAGALALVALYLSRIYTWAAQFPESPDLGTPLANAVQDASDFVTTNWYDATKAIANLVTYGLINPLEALLAETPWYVVGLVIVAISALTGGLRSAATSTVCAGIILATGLWNDAMVTLATTLVAAAVVMVLALVFGVLIARSRGANAVIRPILDAAQVMPPFVYLVPALGLFLATRFTAIVAAVIYAVPVAIKLVADGIASVSPTTVEAAESAGSSTSQVITKVQIPMARSAIGLAANQGLLYVFAMVVIGGLVGAGGLGYLVVAGFSQDQLFGKGLAAGIAIVALAVMMDRMTQHANARGTRR